MANAPILSAISPDRCARDILFTLSTHLAGLATALGVIIRFPEKRKQGTLRKLRAFVSWAQTGAVLDDMAEGTDATHTLLQQLFTAPYSGVFRHAPRFTPKDAVGVVMLAALARIHLARQEPVAAPQLAALASMTLRRVQQLLADGTLKRTTAKLKRGRAMDAPVQWSSAFRFVQERHVPGFVEKAA